MTDASGDDWHKPRSHAQHLTEAEVLTIRKGFVDRRRAHDVARELRCASRTVKKYYAFFREEGVAQDRRPPMSATREG